MPKVKCEFCGAFIDETAEKCPNCGAVNVNYKRFTDATPKTIEELQSWYAARKLPPEKVTRFFIGKDVREPKAFGIYKNGSDVIVYKNKADGSRAIRYQGKDEAYGVNEIYMKLKSEILDQKSRSVKRLSLPKKNVSFSYPSMVFIVIGILFALGILMAFIPSWAFGLFGVLMTAAAVLFRHRRNLMIISLAAILVLFTVGAVAYQVGLARGHRHDGYYQYDDTYYYFQGDDVYYYIFGDWYYYDSYDNFNEYYPDYTYVSDDYEYNEDYRDFEDSGYYEEYSSDSSSDSGSDYDSDWSSDSSSSSSSSDWDWSSDSDYDWDSGSDWDSSDTDWDSDW